MNLMDAQLVTGTSATARLAHLLDWLNGDPLSFEEIGGRLVTFLNWTTAAWWRRGDLIVPRPEPGNRPFTARKQENLRTELLALIERAEGREPRLVSDFRIALPSLRFDVRQFVSGRGHARDHQTGRKGRFTSRSVVGCRTW